ncbi:MAG TPA: XRE family transcriptional regulator [Cellvibrionaceae bacterium]|nr:XRE family transcriptional regulator [Cellvibrionaceae bacterium]HMY37827.1 XRE family transcriptional regulator [Marinagarivorans sp.]HNB02506.1 XRE family transcriptional regulator [Nitrosomonas sp.]HMW46916.1 XRE family transcriptional regulator [Cellvibrionaceae bacterium]HMW70824.1 XRE family transcriptional regulator [Cellvibrionaceae bacterium]
MAVAYAHINPANLRWARERAHLSEAALAKVLKVEEQKLIAWEKGLTKLTFKQAQAFAKQTLTPLGYLFLSSAPVEQLPIPDLRTVDNEHNPHPSAELIKMVYTVIERQEWYKEYVRQMSDAQKNPHIGRFTAQTPATQIVADIRTVLNIPAHPERGNWKDYYRNLIKKIEHIGILVMRQGDLGHYSKPLNVKEFRGFALFDPVAPIIFINRADAPSAQLFTLMHELAHIWIGQSGVSDAKPHTHRAEEILCNAVAAELLVPADEFLSHWQELRNWHANLPVLEAQFHVSQWVLARRALTLGKITRQQYQSYVDSIQQDYKNRERSEGGPSFYRTRKSQVSERFAKALVSETLSGRVLLRDAGKLLDMAPSKISAFAAELGI